MLSVQGLQTSSGIRRITILVFPMSEPKKPPPAKLFVGLLFHGFEVQRQVLSRLNDRFGPLDLLTEAEPFTYTHYYDREMGRGLLRQTGSFLHLVPVEELVAIKQFTNELEKEFTEAGSRRVNIDPGLLSEERIILATGKNFTHRIHLDGGIYADLTLIYQRGGYQGLPWTYPDYQNPLLLHFFNALRHKLIFQRSGRIPQQISYAGESI